MRSMANRACDLFGLERTLCISLLRRHLLIVENLYNLVIQITYVLIGSCFERALGFYNSYYSFVLLNT
jgi:hypothetical protein